MNPPAAQPLDGPAPRTFRLRWQQLLPNRPRGLVLAREAGRLLAWDDKDWIYLFNRAGERQAQAHFAGLTAGCCADDGSAYVAAGSRGEVWWLAPDLRPRWQQAVPHRALAAALDPFGQYVAVADERGHLQVFDCRGRTVCQVQSARPLHYLAFVPAAPYVLASSDYGLVACFDLRGHCLWRDGLVANIGSLAVGGTGEHIVLACFSEGLQQYSLTGQNQGRLPVGEPCRLAALAFDGQTALVAGMSNRLLLVAPNGQILAVHLLDQAIAAIALSPLGDRALVALAEKLLLCFDLEQDRQT